MISVNRLSRFACTALIAAAGITVGLSAPAALAADPVAAAMKSALDTQMPAVVTVKFVMKVEGFGQDQDIESEVPGVMIEKGGLIICSNIRTGGAAAMFGRGGSMTPRDIKILIGDDTEGVEAKLIARDSELDLAWVQINADKVTKDAKGYASIDFSKSASADVGDTVISLSRLGKFFDRAPFAHDTRILGVIKKPRKLLHTKTEEYGAPIFTTSGEPVGVVIVQTPTKEDMEGGGDQERGGLVILPGSEIVAATVKAKEAAASGKPVDPPAPKAEPKTEEGNGKAPQGEPTPPPAAPK